MYCDRCGAQLPDTAAFCTACGKPVLGPVPHARLGRLARHIQPVAILWLIYGGLHVLAGFAVWMVGTVMLPHFLYGPPFHMFVLGWPFPMFLRGVLTSVTALLVALALAGMIAGWGLLQREPWARGLALVVAVFALFNLPWGTALGIYTLWALLPEESAREYPRLAGGV